MSKTCFHPWCGVDGKLCVDCAQAEAKAHLKDIAISTSFAPAIAPAIPAKANLTFEGHVDQWRHLDSYLKAYRSYHFPIGQVVHVKADRYTGYGLAAGQEGVSADNVAVRLENGNTWCYPIECVTAISRDAYHTLPAYVRRQKLAHHRIKPVRTISTPKLP